MNKDSLLRAAGAKSLSPAQQWGVPAHTSISLGTGSLHKEGSISVLKHPPLFYSFSSWGVNPFMTVLDLSSDLYDQLLC